MSSPSQATNRRTAQSLRFVVAGAALALALAGCSGSAATFPPSQTVTPEATATSTATPTAEGSVLAATEVPVATATPTEAPTAAPTTAPTKAPTAAPTLPPLAVGLCTSSQLKLTIDYWIGDGSGSSYAHVYVTNSSSHSCNMRGTPRSQIVNANNLIIVDSGTTSAKVSTADPIVALAPGAKSYDIITWSNWCKAAPAQNVKVEIVLPFGLGPVLAKANGAAPIPNCYAGGSKSTVSAEQWQP